MHQSFDDYDDDDLPPGAGRALRQALLHAGTREIRLGRLHTAAGRSRKLEYDAEDDSPEMPELYPDRQAA